MFISKDLLSVDISDNRSELLFFDLSGLKNWSMREKYMRTIVKAKRCATNSGIWKEMQTFLYSLFRREIFWEGSYSLQIAEMVLLGTVVEEGLKGYINIL